MFAHDPYQSYGLQNPLINAGGFSPYGMNPFAHHQHPAALLAQQALQQQLQNPLIAALYQNPLLAATLQNPLMSLQNPLLQNPILQNPLLNPALAHTLQQHSPFQQTGPIGGLQPQTWIGQGGLQGQPFGGQPFGGQPFGGQPFGGQPFGGQPFGGIHPLLAAQLAGRGANPWGQY